jgi:hypothetical protein
MLRGVSEWILARSALLGSALAPPFRHRPTFPRHRCSQVKAVLVDSQPDSVG